MTPVAAYLALQLPVLQTWAAGKATKVLSKKLNTEVYVGKVYYVFFNKLILKDVHILYTPKDTLLNCKKLSVSISSINLLNSDFSFGRVKLEDGVFNLVSESKYSTNLDRIFKTKEKKSVKDTTKSAPLNLNTTELILKDFRFSLKNKFTSAVDYGKEYINFSDLNVRDIDVDIRKIRYSGDTLFADIRNISCIDKSGFKLERLNGQLELSSKEARINNLILNDGTTKINANYFAFKYEKAKDFASFTEKVVMELDMKDSYLNFATIGKITPSLSKNKLGFFATGLIRGTVSNLRTDSLHVISESGLTDININARISGLPKAKESMAFIDVNNCNTTSLDIAYIISAINSSKPIKQLTSLSPFVKYNFKGRLAGLLTDFVANGHLSSNVGEIDADVLLRTNKKAGGIELIGNLKSESFDVGKLMMKSNLGKLTLKTTVSSLLRDERAGGNRFLIDSLNISNLGLNGYNYKNIQAVGRYENEKFDGKIICHDPNLDFIFQGLFGLSSKTDSYYDFYANIIYANLAALGFDKRDSVSRVSFRTIANFTQTQKGDIVGEIDVRGLNFINSKGDYEIGDIILNSVSNQDKFYATLRSEFAHAVYDGPEIFTSFIEKIKENVLNEHISNRFSFTQREKPVKDGKYNFDIEFFDTKAVTELLLPGLNISKHSVLKIDLNEKNEVNLYLKSSLLGFKNYSCENLNIQGKSNKNMADVNISSDRLSLGGFTLDSTKTRLGLTDNLATVRIGLKNSGEYNSHLLFSSDVKFIKSVADQKNITEIVVNPSILKINKQEWRIDKSFVSLQDSLISVSDFRISNANQELKINGKISRESDESLRVDVNEMDISPINMFIGKPFNIQGKFTGHSVISDWYSNPKVSMDLKGRDLYVYNNKAGDITLKSEWNNERRLFDVNIKNNLGSSIPLEITGTFKPQGSILDLSASLSDLSVIYFEPFLSDIITKTSGSLSGELFLKGPPDKLELTSRNSRFNNFAFTVNFTKVPYILDGGIKLTEDAIVSDNAIIKDLFGNSGSVTGGLFHRYFANMRLNTRVDFRNMECLKTIENDNPSFYGNAFGSGSISIIGPFSNISMDISATTSRNTVVHIPVSSSSEATKTNLLSFIEPPKKSVFNEDLKIKSKEKNRQGTELDLKLKLSVTPDAAMHIEINKSVGDIITGFGTGLISLNVNPKREVFSIYGDYLIDRGDYQFGYALKKFSIMQGGNITFNGDILKTNLNLTAAYRTKASVNTLISDTSSVSNRRTVDCLIKMTGPLMNPALTFSIDIPDIDPTTKTRVTAALNTEDKVVRQVMSLLVTGSFVPDMQSNIVNNTNILYSNLTEILSNQLNNIFNQLEIPLDLNFNYQQASNGKDVFDAAISAQLLNNRVIVNGNIGNSQFSDKTNAVVGNFEAEVKLDDKGKLRAKIFSRSADQYSNYLDGSQRNGVGIAYQEEFNSFKELINRIFKKKKKKKSK